MRDEAAAPSGAPALPGLEFNEEAHRYTYQGRWVPSVTTILKANKLIDTRFYTRSGRNRGSSVHEALEFVDLFGEGEEEAPEEFRGYVRAYLKFKRESGFVPQEVERRLLGRLDSGELFAGTLDRAGLLNGRRFVVDVKTGSAASWHILQLAAYAMADGQGAATAALYLRPSGSYSLAPVHAADAMNARLAWIAHVRAFYMRGGGEEEA